MTRYTTTPRFTAAPLAPPPRPDRSWIVYLTLDGHSNDEIRQRLAADDLPPLTDVELDAYRIAYPVPVNFTPTSSTHLATLTFIYKAGLSVFFDPNPTRADAVLRLLRSGRGREVVEAATLSGAPASQVVDVLSRRLGTLVEETTLEDYEHVFFEVRHVARAQLRLLIEQRVSQAVSRVAQGDRAAARRAIAADSRVVACSMGPSRLAWASITLGLGWPPAPVDLAQAVGDMETLATVRVHEALAAPPGDDVARRGDAYAGVLTSVRKLREGITQPQSNLAAELARFRIQQDVSEPTTVAQLAADGDGVGSLDVEPRSIDNNEEDANEKPTRRKVPT